MNKTYSVQWTSNEKEDLLNMAIFDSRQNIEELLLQKLLRAHN